MLYFITVLLAAVILLWSHVSAYNTGKATSQADTVIANTKAYMQGFEYFYSDQNRYPSAVDFAESEVMNIYTNGFPAHEFITSACPSSFLYKRVSNANYQLNFCLPGGTQGFTAGWHQAQNAH